MENSLLKIRDRTISSVARVVDEVAEVILSWVGNISCDLARSQDIDHLRSKINECITPKGGEVKARHNTIALGNLYLKLSDIGKAKFLRLLNDEFSSKRGEIDKSIEAYMNNMDVSMEEKLRFDLLTVLHSPRFHVLKQFMSLSEGVKFLVDMRADVINFGKRGEDFFALERDLRSVLSSLFDVGLLDLRQITWDSPASLLEKLIMYEAVHAITSWEDMRYRLDSDRRCFAFFHYKMQREPLIFVEVALTDTVADSIQVLLDDSVPKSNPKGAKVAVFYSISNTQVGLSRINLGNFLIKRVVGMLSDEFSGIKTYVTLSPIPGFVVWLKMLLQSDGEKVLGSLGIVSSVEEIVSCMDSGDYADFSVSTRDLFLKLCAYYLARVKKQDKAWDPVAHFHLSNGASIKRLNWMADSSDKGLAGSMGIMVNYHYELSKIDDNYEAYVVHRKINCSREFLSLLRR